MKTTIRRILVAVDLSESRDAAFDRALLLARGWNAALFLLHTQGPRPVSRFAIAGEDLELESNKAEQSHLRALVRSAKDDGVEVQVISADGAPAPAIAAYAQLVAADLSSSDVTLARHASGVLRALRRPSADRPPFRFSSCHRGRPHPAPFLSGRSRRLSLRWTLRWRRPSHCEWRLTSSHKEMDEQPSFTPCRMRRRWCFPAVRPPG